VQHMTLPHTEPEIFPTLTQIPSAFYILPHQTQPDHPTAIAINRPTFLFFPTNLTSHIPKPPLPPALLCSPLLSLCGYVTQVHPTLLPRAIYGLHISYAISKLSILAYKYRHAARSHALLSFLYQTISCACSLLALIYLSVATSDPHHILFPYFYQPFLSLRPS
jgi:hypothetical protein